MGDLTKKTDSELIESVTKLHVTRTDMTTFASEKWVIRVWREEEDYTAAIAQANFMLFSHLVSQNLEVPMIEVARKALAVDRVNAVEITNSAGQGVVLYKDWP